MTTFHSNVKEVKEIHYSLLQDLVPLHSFSLIKDPQIEYNAPLNTFSPKIEENPSELDVDIHMESIKAIEDTQTRLDSKIDKIKRFRETLCQRVVDRTKDERHRLAEHETLFLETQERLLRYAIVEKSKDTSAALEKQQMNQEQNWTGVLTDPILVAPHSAAQSNKKSVLGTRLHQLTRVNHSIRSAMLKNCQMQHNNSDSISESSTLEEDSHSIADKKRIADMEHVLFTPQERAQLFAAVRRSYMEVERNKVRLRDSRVQRPTVVKSVIVDETPISTDAIKQETSFIINATEGKKLDIKQISQNVSSPSARASSVGILSPKSTVSKTTPKDGARYIAALQKMEASPAICACPQNSPSGKRAECANNCALYNNPRKANKLLMSSRAHHKK